jgi:hypothetical protein
MARIKNGTGDCPIFEKRTARRGHDPISSGIVSSDENHPFSPFYGYSSEFFHLFYWRNHVGTPIAFKEKYILHPILPIHGPAIPPKLWQAFFLLKILPIDLP